MLRGRERLNRTALSKPAIQKRDIVQVVNANGGPDGPLHNNATLISSESLKRASEGAELFYRQGFGPSLTGNLRSVQKHCGRNAKAL